MKMLTVPGLNLQTYRLQSRFTGRPSSRDRLRERISIQYLQEVAFDNICSWLCKQTAVKTLRGTLYLNLSNLTPDGQ